MSEIEKLKEIIRKFEIENLLLRISTIIALYSFVAFFIYMMVAIEYDFKAEILAILLLIQNIIIAIFEEVNK